MSTTKMPLNTNQQSSDLLLNQLISGVAIGLIIVVGLIHFVDAPDNFSEVAYKGVLFVLNGLGALLAAYGIYNRHSWGWLLGFVVAGGAFVMYVVSRTIGLPGIGIDDAWLEPMGVLSLVVEAGFVALFIRTMLRKQDA